MTTTLVCPLCHAAVAPNNSGCRPCHLPMSDVLRHQRSATRSSRLARALWVRLTGLVLYGAVVAWCAYALREALPFVVPGAALGGGVLHAWKGRPWLGLVVFAIIVVVVPVLLVPALGVGTYSDLTDWISDLS